MDDTENVGGRDRLARAVLAAVLTVAAISSLRNGKRLRGLLAGVGALAFGFNATTKYCGLNDALGIDTTEPSPEGEAPAAGTAETVTTTGDSERAGGLTCAACGDPIVPGQSRGPDEDDRIVHDSCQ